MFLAVLCDQLGECNGNYIRHYVADYSNCLAICKATLTPQRYVIGQVDRWSRPMSVG